MYIYAVIFYVLCIVMWQESAKKEDIETYGWLHPFINIFTLLRY